VAERGGEGDSGGGEDLIVDEEGKGRKSGEQRRMREGEVRRVEVKLLDQGRQDVISKRWERELMPKAWMI